MLEAVEERSDNTIEASESTNHHFKDQSSESFYVKPIKDSKIQIQLV